MKVKGGKAQIKHKNKKKKNMDTCSLCHGSAGPLRLAYILIIEVAKKL